MEWSILFIVSWILFFLLVDWKRLKRNAWCGIAAVALQLLVDTQAMTHGLYGIHRYIFPIWRTPGLFALGPVFTIATLLAQYHPKSRRMRIVNVLVLTVLYSLQELLLVIRENVVYTNWHYFDSVQVNMSVMIMLDWFTMTILEIEE